MSLRRRLEALERAALGLRPAGPTCPACRAPIPSLPRILLVDLSAPGSTPETCRACGQYGGAQAVPLDGDGKPRERVHLGAGYFLGPLPGAEDELEASARRWGQERAPLGALLAWLEARPAVLPGQREALQAHLRARFL